jgi:hypothetical protein
VPVVTNALLVRCRFLLPAVGSDPTTSEHVAVFRSVIASDVHSRSGVSPRAVLLALHDPAALRPVHRTLITLLT